MRRSWKWSPDDPLGSHARRNVLKSLTVLASDWLMARYLVLPTLSGVTGHPSLGTFAVKLLENDETMVTRCRYLWLVALVACLWTGCNKNLQTALPKTCGSNGIDAAAIVQW